MGAVYEAADLRLARSVAVKIMLGRAFGDRQALRRFEREAQACARLTHPNIITVYRLRRRRRRRRVPGDGAGAGTNACATSSGAAGTCRLPWPRRGSSRSAKAWRPRTSAQVVHRDLKPENVVIAETATGGEILKVLDFGLAKVRTGERRGVRPHASRCRDGDGRLHGAGATQRRRSRPARRRLRDRRHGRRGHRRTAAVPRPNLRRVVAVHQERPGRRSAAKGSSCGGSSRCCAARRPTIRRCATRRSRSWSAT